MTNAQLLSIIVNLGDVAEWSKAHAWKGVYMLIAYRGFESLRHRQTLKILYRLLPMWDFFYELMGLS